MNFYMMTLGVVAILSMILFTRFRNMQARRDHKRRERLANRRAELLDKLHNNKIVTNNKSDD